MLGCFAMWWATIGAYFAMVLACFAMCGATIGAYFAVVFACFATICTICGITLLGRHAGLPLRPFDKKSRPFCGRDFFVCGELQVLPCGGGKHYGAGA
jgi:hypothetical protein